MATAAVLSIGVFDNTATAFVAALLLGALVGGVNGYLVSYRRVTPFLATLATMIVLQGIRFAYTKGAPSGSLPDAFRFLATGDIGGVPVVLIVLIGVGFVAHWMLERSVPGRQLLLYGDNPETAYMAGLPVTRHRDFSLCHLRRSRRDRRPLPGRLRRNRRQLDRTGLRAGQHRRGSDRRCVPGAAARAA